MPNEEASLLVRLIQGGGRVVAIGAPLLGIPVIGAIGTIVEKMPLAEFEEWLGSHSSPRTEPDMNPPPAVNAASKTAASKIARPPLFEPEQVRGQYENIATSEPFLMAILTTLKELPFEIERFLVETYSPSSDTQYQQARVGLWPAFAIEWVARQHFFKALGESVAVQESPKVRGLVEIGLAREAIDLIIGQTSAGGDVQPLLLGARSQVFAANISYNWPQAEGFAPGYVIAHVPEFLSTPLPTEVSEGAKAACHALVARLGRLSVGGRDELTCAWYRTCESYQQAAAVREAQGTYVNRSLCQLEYPLLLVHDQSSRNAIRAALEPVLAKHERRKTRPLFREGFIRRWMAIVSAYAANDVEAFKIASRPGPLTQLWPEETAALRAIAEARGWESPA